MQTALRITELKLITLFVVIVSSFVVIFDPWQMTSVSDTMFPIDFRKSKGSRFKEEHKANGSLSIWRNA